MRSFLLKLIKRSRLERDLEEELSFHRAMSARPFGNATRIREEARDLWTFSHVENLIRDLLHACRSLRKSPTYTIVSLLTLGLGIGINTATFTLYDALTFRLLPVASPKEVFRVVRESRGTPQPAVVSYAEFEKLRAGLEPTADLFASSPSRTIFGSFVGEAQTPEGIKTQFVSDNYFDALQLKSSASVPVLLSDKPNVAVASYSYWARRLKSDRAVIGKLISLRGVLVKIVAIAPKGFYGTELPPRAPDLWMPFGSSWTAPTLAKSKSDGTLRLHLLGRRRPGVTNQQVSSHLDAIVRARDKNRGKLAAEQATTFQTNIGGFRGTSTIGIILLGAVSIILLIGCVNLINLTLSRNEARKREIAVRLAIGANRFQIVQQLCAEGLLLGLAGGIIGFGLSIVLCHWIRIEAFAALHRLSDEIAAGLQLDLSPDWTVFVYTLLISLVAGAIVGVWPAWSSTQTDLNASLRREGLNRGQRHFLLTAQIAACFILLSAAGLLVRGAWQSRSARPGFEVDHLLVMTLDMSLLDGPGAERAATLKATLNQINAVPDVTSVALVDRSPFLGTGARVIENENHKHLACRFNRTSAAYFKTLRMPLLSGRSFSQAEADGGKPEVVISEAAATALWPNQNPIGRIIHVPDAQSFGFRHNEFTVIGVTRVVRNTFLSKPDTFYLYFPKPISDEGGWVIARTEHSPEAALPSVREALMHASPALASHSYLMTLENGPVQIQKLMTDVPGMTSLALGLLALILAAIGVYGVVMYLVNQRVRSIGIHIALGAQRVDIIRLVVGEGLSCVVKGACIGLAGGLAVSALLATSMKAPDLPDLTYQAGAWNPLVFVCPLAALVIAVVAACLQPVLRATRIPPALVLRAD